MENDDFSGSTIEPNQRAVTQTMIIIKEMLPIIDICEHEICHSVSCARDFLFMRNTALQIQTSQILMSQKFHPHLSFAESFFLWAKQELQKLDALAG